LLDKFDFLTQEALGHARSREVVDAVEALDTLEDVRDLTALLRVA
jgi:hypothetical protein